MSWARFDARKRMQAGREVGLFRNKKKDDLVQTVEGGTVWGNLMKEFHCVLLSEWCVCVCVLFVSVCVCLSEMGHLTFSSSSVFGDWKKIQFTLVSQSTLLSFSF